MIRSGCSIRLLNLTDDCIVFTKSESVRSCTLPASRSRNKKLESRKRHRYFHILVIYSLSPASGSSWSSSPSSCQILRLEAFRQKLGRIGRSSDRRTCTISQNSEWCVGISQNKQSARVTGFTQWRLAAGSWQLAVSGAARPWVNSLSGRGRLFLGQI